MRVIITGHVQSSFRFPGGSYEIITALLLCGAFLFLRASEPSLRWIGGRRQLSEGRRCGAGKAVGRRYRGHEVGHPAVAVCDYFDKMIALNDQHIAGGGQVYRMRVALARHAVHHGKEEAGQRGDASIAGTSEYQCR